MRNVFVDGYNVINSWPELKLIKDYSLEGARHKLIEMLQNYATFKGYKIFLVFDAHLVVGSIEKKERYGEYLIVVFTKEGETADVYIEKKVNDIGRKWEVCVVTSDLVEQQVTFQRGAIRMSSLEFYHEVKSIERKISSKIENNGKVNRDTIEDRIKGEVLEKLLKIRKSH
ncbi:NYN domain-containing protein [Clostridium sp. MSJ-11]|uniref:NYN domain-containing protein n=1 Tax=Clostridium mobile TaxID=2841512 RepID=A0ABS6EII4_9CLOT|nr:NYN domain-containing protein [Clostridium mobile]MBU5485014.1 NYN domain-containing protein [Clostridium mobile]